MLLHGNNGYAKAPQCYVVRKLSVYYSSNIKQGISVIAKIIAMIRRRHVGLQTLPTCFIL